MQVLPGRKQARGPAEDRVDKQTKAADELEQEQKLREEVALREKLHLDALDWTAATLTRFISLIALHPGDPVIRQDASLITEAADELITGREPRSVTGLEGRQQRPVSEEAKKRLRRIWELRKQIPRSPASGGRTLREVPLDLGRLGLRPIPAGSRDRAELARKAWQDLCFLAELTDEEAEVMQMCRGLDYSISEAADYLGMHVRTVRRRLEIAISKIETFIETRHWDDSFLTTR